MRAVTGLLTQLLGSNIILPFITGCLGVLLLVRYLWLRLSRPKRLLPPGPKGKLLVGNLFDLPPHGASQEAHWTEHKKLYGPISSMNVLGQNFIIINDPKIGKELLDKRATNYSQRPTMIMAGELCGVDHGIILTQANDRHRNLRRVAHNQLGSLSSLQKWNGDIDIETRRYLYHVLVRPEQWASHIRHEAGAIILKIVYGYTVEPHTNDALVDLANQTMDVFVKAAVPGAWMVDMIPALKYVPSWFPGAGFQKTAAEWKSIIHAGAIRPFEFTKRQIMRGQAPLSLVSESLKKVKGGGTSESADDVMWAASSMFAGGADTTVAVMEMMYLAMTKYPDVQRKAQAEIDMIVGRDRLPQPSDRPNLPYLEALTKECLRWHAILEVTIPHLSKEDDFYEQYFIPKNSMMLFNLSGLFHDAEHYSNPSEFNPDRFLGISPELDPNELIWGFGRRICPGRWLAMSNLWLQVSRTIACFKIKAIPGEDPAVEFTYGVVRRPVPFRADVRLRSPEYEQLIRTVADEHPFPTEGDSKLL